MSRRSLPERTVDAWVSTAICVTFPHARIWGPTQAIKQTNWDYGASLGEGKIFILEDKGTTAVERRRQKPLDTHRIHIDMDQLDWYCDEVEPATGVPVYYVLPQPPWIGAATGSDVVPDQAICRVESATGRFEAWTFVSRCSDLRGKLGGLSSIDTDRLPLAGGWSLAEFFRHVQECEIGRRISGAGEPSLSAARSAEQVGQPPRASVQDRTNELRPSQSVGSALAVFVPSEDLPGWRQVSEDGWYARPSIRS
jgi:hypothetical protein